MTIACVLACWKAVASPTPRKGACARCSASPHWTARHEMRHWCPVSPAALYNRRSAIPCWTPKIALWARWAASFSAPRRAEHWRSWAPAPHAAAQSSPWPAAPTVARGPCPAWPACRAPRPCAFPPRPQGRGQRSAQPPRPAVVQRQQPCGPSHAAHAAAAPSCAADSVAQADARPQGAAQGAATLLRPARRRWAAGPPAPRSAAAAAGAAGWLQPLRRQARARASHRARPRPWGAARQVPARRAASASAHRGGGGPPQPEPA